jgi:hypothetical protein
MFCIFHDKFLDAKEFFFGYMKNLIFSLGRENVAPYAWLIVKSEVSSENRILLFSL